MTLRGLIAAPHHNGKVGRIAEATAGETGRWPVFVFADSKLMSLKPENLAASVPGVDAIEAFLHALTVDDKCKAFGNGQTLARWDDELLCGYRTDRAGEKRITEKPPSIGAALSKRRVAVLGPYQHAYCNLVYGTMLLLARWTDPMCKPVKSTTTAPYFDPHVVQRMHSFPQCGPALQRMPEEVRAHFEGIGWIFYNDWLAKYDRQTILMTHPHCVFC